MAKRNTSFGNRRKVKARGRQPLLLLIAFAAVAIFAASIVYADRTRENGSAVVASIDGEPVTYDEFIMHMAGRKAATVGLFQSRDHAETGPDFWTTEYNGVTPLEQIKQDTLDDLVRTKVQEIMAKREGLIGDISYDAIRKGLEAENKRRAETVRGGGVVYGPVRYDAAEYDSVVRSNLEGELRKLYEQRSSFTDDELRGYYDAHPELYKRQDTIKIRKITASGEDAEQKLNTVRERLGAGKTLEEATADMGSIVTVEAQTLDASTAHGDSLAYPILYRKALELEPGGLTDVFRENGADQLVLCTERTAEASKPFEEVKEAIRSYLAGAAYDQAVDAMVKAAAVDIHHDVYDRIGADAIG